MIVDLEDAVAPDAKDAARDALAAWLDAPGARPVLVRVNGADTPWHAADLAVCRSPAVAGILLPKAETAAAMAHAHAATGKPVLPIIESAAGLHQLLPVASAPGCARLVFGKLDLEQGEEDSEEAVFQPYRAQLVLASRVAGLASPVDGIFTALDDSSGLAAYTRRARRDGIGAHCDRNRLGTPDAGSRTCSRRQRRRGRRPYDRCASHCTRQAPAACSRSVNSQWTGWLLFRY